MDTPGSPQQQGATIRSILNRYSSKISESLKENKSAKDYGWYLMSQLPVPVEYSEDIGPRAISVNRTESGEETKQEEDMEREVNKANLVVLLRRTSRNLVSAINQNKPHLESGWYIMNGFPVPLDVETAESTTR